MKNHKIIFCGLDEKLFQLFVENQDFHVKAVNLIPELYMFKSINPTDILFKIIYKNITKQSFFLNSILIFLLNIFIGFGSKLTKKYYIYIKILVIKKISIVDFSKIQETVKYINSNNIELLVVSNWWILPDSIIYAPKYGAVNVHPSKLPKYRGSVPTLWSLKNKDIETAVSLIKLNSKIDGGDIISQHIIPIYSDDNAISLELRCDATIKEFIITDIYKYLSSDVKLSLQDNTIASVTARYHEYRQINWLTEAKEEIVNKIKLYPYLWPLDHCYYLFKNKKIVINDATICHEIPIKIIHIKNRSPGSVSIFGKFIYIKTINGMIKFELFVDLSWFNSIKHLVWSWYLVIRGQSASWL